MAGAERVAEWFSRALLCSDHSNQGGGLHTHTQFNELHGQSVPESAMAQLRALFRKNVQLKSVSKCQTSCEVLSPLIICWLLSLYVCTALAVFAPP